MTLCFFINILTTTLCLTTALSSFGQLLTLTGFQVDTSKTAIIPFEKEKRFQPFDTSYKAAFLTQDEIGNIDSLLIVAVNNYNESLEQNRKALAIDLSKYDYRKQLIAGTNSKAEKEVYVNCFAVRLTIIGQTDGKQKFLLLQTVDNVSSNLKLI